MDEEADLILKIVRKRECAPETQPSRPNIPERKKLENLSDRTSHIKGFIRFDKCNKRVNKSHRRKKDIDYLTVVANSPL